MKTYHTKFAAMFYVPFPAHEKKKNPTEFKIVCEGPEERVVGLHLLGLGKLNLIQSFCYLKTTGTLWIAVTKRNILVIVSAFF